MSTAGISSSIAGFLNILNSAQETGVDKTLGANNSTDSSAGSGTPAYVLSLESLQNSANQDGALLNSFTSTDAVSSLSSLLPGLEASFSQAALSPTAAQELQNLTSLGNTTDNNVIATEDSTISSLLSSLSGSSTDNTYSALDNLLLPSSLSSSASQELTNMSLTQPTTASKNATIKAMLNSIDTTA